MSRHITIKVDTLKVNFTPYALAKMSNGLFVATELYKEEDVLTLKYFLYCTSIELGFKASILSVGNSKKAKDELKYTVGHDLVKVNNLFIQRVNIDILDTNDLLSLKKINPFFKTKGLEYVTTDVIVELANGTPNFPGLRDIRSIAEKINKYLLKNKLYINS